MADLADWQLPAGVSRAVWDYAHDSSVAAGYDAELAGTPLLEADKTFVLRRLRRPGWVLDLGCGTGRMTIELAKAGHRVTGIDLSPAMLHVARTKAASWPIDFACGNIVDLSMMRNESFDAAVCLFSTLGMIAGHDARQRTVAEAFRVLRPGSELILHGHNLGHLITTRAGRRMLVHDLGRRCRNKVDAGDFPMPARPGSPAWTMHLFTRRELLQLVRSAGFVLEEVQAVRVDGTIASCWSARWAYGLLVAARRPADKVKA